MQANRWACMQVDLPAWRDMRTSDYTAVVIAEKAAVLYLLGWKLQQSSAFHVAFLVTSFVPCRQ